MPDPPIPQLQSQQAKGDKPKRRRRNKGNKKKGTVKKNDPIKKGPTAAIIPYTNRNYKLKNGIPSNLSYSDFSNSLTKEEKKMAISWLLNMLDPQKEFRFPRPVPALSDTDLKGGEIFFDTAADYCEIRVRPDPFDTIMIRQLGVTASVNIAGLDDFGENFNVYNSTDPQAVFITGDHHINTQLQLPLNDGKFLSPSRVNKVGALSGGFVNQEIDAAAIFMYAPMTPPSANLVARWINNSNVTVGVSLGWIIRSSDGTVVSNSFGTVVSIAGNSSQNVNSAAFNILPVPLSNQFVSFTFKITVPPDSRVAVSSQAFEFVTMTGLNVTAPVSTEYWTLGQATYGKSTSDAQILDDIINDCQLWAPCGLSTKFNVDQQLNAAGGRFQTAFLPSRIDQKLPSDFPQLWTYVDSRKTSYPVAETPFVKGAQGSWIGMRIQDYEFRRPFVTEQFRNFELESTPQVHFLAKKVAAAEVTYRLDFNFAYEIQTTHPAYTMSVGLFHPGFAGLMGALVASHKLLVGENPSHTQRLTKLAKQVVSNPMVQQAFKQLLTMGLTLL